MALILRQTIKPAGTFPAVEAADVLMPDGTRLSEFEGGGDVLVVTVDRNFVASHSASEIRNATEKGKAVLLRPLSAEHEEYHLHYVSDENVAHFYKVEIPYKGINYISWIGYKIGDDKSANPLGYRGTYYTLPDPSGVENGKVLVIENGNPIWSEVSNTLIVTGDFDSETVSNVSHTVTDIKAAVDAGKPVILHLNWSGCVIPLKLDYADGFYSRFYSPIGFQHAAGGLGDNQLLFAEVVLARPNSATCKLTTHDGLPSCSTDDNGKILQVVNGKWKSVEMSDSAVKDYIDEYISSALEGEY